MEKFTSDLQLVLVEDEVVYSKMIMYQLSQVKLDDRQVSANHVRSIAEFEEISAFIEPEIILLDLGLPDSNGEGSFTKVQSICPNAAIIVLTGNEYNGLGADLIKKGAQDFILKTEVTQTYLNRTITYTFNRNSIAKKVEFEKSLYKLAFYNIPLPILIYNATSMMVMDTNHALKRSDGSGLSREWQIALNAFLTGQSKQFFSISEVVEINYIVSGEKRSLRITRLEGDNYLIQLEFASENDA